MFSQYVKKYNLSFLGIAVFLLFIFVLGQSCHVEAATLGISPLTTQVVEGQTVTVSVFVSSPSQSINAASGVVSFPVANLEVVSVSKNNSVFNFWASEPSFSNTGGSVNFEGVVLNPGFTGSNGKVLNITFRGKKSSPVTLTINSASVLANDGQGTNVLQSVGSGLVDVQPQGFVPAAPDSTTPPTVPGVSGAPIITSTTHPDSSKWYNKKDAELKWYVPSDVIAVSTLISRSAVSVPTIVYTPPVSSKTVSNLDDGIWYFHVRFKNDKGWGSVAHFRIQIDTVSPVDFKITFPHGSVTNDPRPVTLFNTTDNLSGIDHYEVKVGESQFFKVALEDVNSNPYTPPLQDPGTHSIIVKAVDLAGNETVQTSEFTISSINVPEITEYPSELNVGDLLRIRGTSYTSVDIEVVVEDSAGHRTSQTLTTNTNGGFSTIWAKNLAPGSYKLMARSIDGRDAKSSFSEGLNFTVKNSAFTILGTLALNWLSVLVLFILVVGGLILLSLYFVRHTIRLRKSIRHDIRSAESNIHKVFNDLRSTMKDQVKMLEKVQSKRELTKEEEKMISKLQDQLAKSEDTIEDELSKIEEKII